MLGYGDDPRVRHRAEVLVADDRWDGGYLCDRSSFSAKTKSCIRGSIKALTAFAALPALWDSERCRKLVSYFLKRRVFYRMTEPDQVVRDELVGTIFPFVIQGSLLEPLHALNVMGYGQHEALDDAWERLAAKRGEGGRYILNWYAPSYFTPGKKGVVNKWVTLYAYLALKYRHCE
jgi:hypothetical protein